MHIPKGDLYVVIVGHDGVEPADGPMVWEHYLSRCSLAQATSQALNVADRYGGAVLAKLEILNIEFEPTKETK